jgi:hypothetical protein
MTHWRLILTIGLSALIWLTARYLSWYLRPLDRMGNVQLVWVLSFLVFLHAEGLFSAWILKRGSWVLAVANLLTASIFLVFLWNPFGQGVAQNFRIWGAFFYAIETATLFVSITALTRLIGESISPALVWISFMINAATVALLVGFAWMLSHAKFC